MAYSQYTRCIDPAHYYRPWSPTGMAALSTLFIVGPALALATGGIGWIGWMVAGVALVFAAVVGLLFFVHWWLYVRLICLGGERCALGLVISVEPPQDQSLDSRPDTDYSFNLLLAPNGIGATQGEVESDGLQGDLIKGQPGPTSIGQPTPGQPASACDSDRPSAVLHCEFEGAGVYIFYQWLQVLLAILILATIALLLGAPGLLGWIVLVLVLLGLVAGYLQATSNVASPADVDPSLGGALHWGCGGQGADLLVVSGEWVYDSLHQGFNEIHPVRSCQRIGYWAGSWGLVDTGTGPPEPFDWQAIRDRWCAAIASAGSPTTIDNQQKPENQWTIHPSIDGCQPPVVIG
jgi:hypothetical protein